MTRKKRWKDKGRPKQAFDAVERSEHCAPTRERLAHADHADQLQNGATRVNVVDRLHYDGRISGEAHSAAYRLLRDWYYGGLSQRVTADPQREVVDTWGHGDAFDVNRMQSARNYSRAIGALAPPHRHPIQSMVLADTSTVEYGRQYLGWKDKNQASVASRAMLIPALEELAKHYGQKSPRRVEDLT